MGIKISKDHLHPSVIESITSLIGDLSMLETDAKGNAVEAINELLANTESTEGKKLIANAVGEPLNADDSFQDMSNDINGLLSTFKTNMMNNGVTVESGDKFKTLIDKIATMVEEGQGKGIQIVSGTLQDYVVNTDTFNFFVKDSSNYTYDYASYVEIKDLSFRPSFVFINAYNEEGGGYIHNYAIVNNFNNNQYNNENNKPSVITGRSDVSSIGSGEAATYMADEKVFVDDSTIHVPLEFWSDAGSNIDYLIIGVGEEDTALRDSLADILEEEGVEVTEEDDMASLITKVDEEFSDNKQQLVDKLNSEGLNVSTNSTFEELIGNITLGGKFAVGTTVGVNPTYCKLYYKTGGQPNTNNFSAYEFRNLGFRPSFVIAFIEGTTTNAGQLSFIYSENSKLGMDYSMCVKGGGTDFFHNILLDGETFAIYDDGFKLPLAFALDCKWIAIE